MRMAKEHKNPLPTVDIIIELGRKGIVLIERKNHPYGWAIPGGFVDEGEGLEDAAGRDAKGIGVFTEDGLPGPLAFDHSRILRDYFRWKREGFKVFEM